MSNGVTAIPLIPGARYHLEYVSQGGMFSRTYSSVMPSDLAPSHPSSPLAYSSSRPALTLAPHQRSPRQSSPSTNGMSFHTPKQSSSSSSSFPGTPVMHAHTYLSPTSNFPTILPRPPGSLPASTVPSSQPASQTAYVFRHPPPSNTTAPMPSETLHFDIVAAANTEPSILRTAHNLAGLAEGHPKVRIAKEARSTLAGEASSTMNCPYCSKCFKNRRTLKKHTLRKHVDPSSKMYRCTQCSKSYAIESDLKAHQKWCGSTFVCECGLDVSSLNALKRHCSTFQHKPGPRIAFHKRKRVGTEDGEVNTEFKAPGEEGGGPPESADGDGSDAGEQHTADGDGDEDGNSSSNDDEMPPRMTAVQSEEGAVAVAVGAFMMLAPPAQEGYAIGDMQQLRENTDGWQGPGPQTESFGSLQPPTGDDRTSVSAVSM